MRQYNVNNSQMEHKFWSIQEVINTSPSDRAIYLQNFISFVLVYSGAYETRGLKCQTWGDYSVRQFLLPPIVQFDQIHCYLTCLTGENIIVDIYVIQINRGVTEILQFPVKLVKYVK